MNRDDDVLAQVEEPGVVLPGADMAGRSGLRDYRATSDEYLEERPEELLARLARVTRLPAITDALVFPDHPSLRARWDRELERWVSRTTGRPVDAIAFRDRALHLHRNGESAPSAIVPFRKTEDAVRVLLALEELDRFRALSAVQVAQSDLDALTSQIRELSGAVAELRVLPRDVPSTSDGAVTVDAPPEDPGSGALPTVEDILPAPPRVEPPPPPQAQPVAPPRTLRERILARLELEDRDWGSLFWLSFAAVVSSYTTWTGAHNVGLPDELAAVGTLFLCGYLWTLLIGAAMQHDKRRKLIAELAIGAVCIYAGFSFYYEGITGTERATQATTRATEAHEQLVARYNAAAGELATAQKEVERLQGDLDGEIERGSAGTGLKGYGTTAKAIAAELRTARSKAAQLEGKLAPVEAVVHEPVAALTPDAVHLLDVRIWSAMPAEWRAAEPPRRDVYVDSTLPTSPILLPLVATRSGEPEALLALGCASAVEGLMIFMGLGLDKRRERRRLIPAVARAVSQVGREGRDAVASLRATRAAEARARYLYSEDE